jgi:L-fucose isomerase-like protein
MPKIGFISVGHPDYINDTSAILKYKAIESMEKIGIQVISAEKTAADSQSARLFANKLIKQDLDGVVLFLETWMECPVAMSAIREIEHLPFALWGTPMFNNNGQSVSTGSFVSFAMFKGSLDRLEYNYEAILGQPSQKSVIEKIKAFAIAAEAYSRMKITSIGLVGYTSMSIYPGTFDHLLMRKAIGPEIVQMDTYTLLNKMGDIKDSECDDTIQYLKSTAKIRNDVTNENLITVSKMYLALKKICDSKHLSAINVKCQYELSKKFGMTACVPLSVLAENGVVASCEGDILVTVSMLMLNYLSKSITAYADIININEDNTIKLSPCGFIPYSLGDKDKREIRKFMPNVGFKGIQNSFVYKPGKVTLLRLVEDRFDYHIIYTVGTGLPTELRQGYMPALDVDIGDKTQEFIEHLAGQHYAFCYGDFSAELNQLAKIMKIKCIRI